MSKIIQFESGKDPAAGIDPDLRAFIDRVIVPILVREYLAVQGAQNELAEGPPRAAHFPRGNTTRILEGEVRP